MSFIQNLTPFSEGREEPRNSFPGMIPWEEAVAEGSTMTSKADPWRYGELALLVEPVHGEATTERFAEAIGVEFTALKKYRATVKAWPTKEGRASYAVCQALNAHDFRYDIVKARPNLTRDEAREIMGEWKSEHTSAAETTVAKVEKRLKKSFAAFLTPDSKMSEDVDFLCDSVDAQTIDLDLLEEIRAAQKRLADALTQMETMVHTIDGYASKEDVAEEAAKEEPPANAKKKPKKAAALPPLQ